MKTFRLQNVKSFSDTNNIELKPLTIFVGKNSSGKSSLVRFPVVLNQTLQEDTISPLLFHGREVDYGNFRDVVHHHKGNELQFSLGFNLKDLFDFGFSFGGLVSLSSSFYPLVQTVFQTYTEINLDVTIKNIMGKLVVNNYQISLDGNPMFSVQRQDDNFSKYKFSLYYFPHNQESPWLDNPILLPATHTNFEKFILISNTRNLITQKEFINTFQRLIQDIFNYKIDEYASIISEIAERIEAGIQFTHIKETLKKTEKGKEILNCLSMIIDVLILAENLSNNLNKYLQGFSKKFSYIGPFRSSPSRSYRHSESLRKSVGKDGEHLGILLRQVYKNQPDSFQKISNWFILAMGYKIEIEEILESNFFRIKVYSHDNSKGDDLIDVGFGISQILPIVTQLYYDEMDEHHETAKFFKGHVRTFIFEQPEIHLHPQAQAQLANLFVDKVLNARQQEQKVQILIETHSEHLITRLQSLVASSDNPFSKDDVAIYYVGMSEPGKSMITKMELTETGQFTKKWPVGFFDSR